MKTMQLNYPPGQTREIRMWEVTRVMLTRMRMILLMWTIVYDNPFINKLCTLTILQQNWKYLRIINFLALTLVLFCLNTDLLRLRSSSACIY